MKMNSEDTRMKMVLEKCICRQCPTFVDCKEKIGYCFVSKSKCIKDKKGCICGQCPVYGIVGLAHYYYCIDGSEQELLKKEKKK